ncbi:hypothetical protein ACFY0F_29855 [Streptomyces sp. NPDC001544]|uniref:hypothetical protein n=1 Tax=Streptomyces sp. NPDC001544 TaxID=3364584 RepID=UPI0036CD4234
MAATGGTETRRRGRRRDGLGCRAVLDAALYRAAARIPGVSVVENAEDFTGRSGIGADKEALLGTAVADKPGEEPGN